MSRQNSNGNFWCKCFLIVVLYICISRCTVTSINTYVKDQISHKTPEIEKTSHTHRISVLEDNKSDKSISRSDKVGNVIFNDNIAFSAGSVYPGDNSRNKGQHFSNGDVAGGLLRNHRLEGTLSSPEIASNVAAAAVATSSHSLHSENDLRIASDNVHTAVHAGNNVVRGAGVTEIGQGRSFLPGEGLNGQHGWASNPGSCLFSCSSGSFGYNSPVSCCQQNYVQCCPNPQHEQWNFKNLHHGRGNFLGGGLAGGLGGGISKGGYGWGSIPYNPPPIIRPKPCGSYHHAPPIIIPPIGGGGSIIHKGIETIKHNIGHIDQFFKSGTGWGAGGNGAAGYYFHRRSDNDDSNNKLVQFENGDTRSPAKRRTSRSVNHAHGGWVNNGGFDKIEPVPVPCPAYNIQPSYPPRPYNTGIGSLIGWTKINPGNQIHEHGGGFGVGYSNTLSNPPVYSTNGGHGWGRGFGSNFCKSDFECPGYQKCCKGVCQNAPQQIH